MDKMPDWLCNLDNERKTKQFLANIPSVSRQQALEVLKKAEHLVINQDRENEATSG